MKHSEHDSRPTRPSPPEELDGGAIEAGGSPDDTPLDSLEKALVSRIQSGFPITAHPYAVLGQELGISETETLERIRQLRYKKIIRRIGANFDSKRLGFRSTLCAAKVPEDKLEAFINEVNKRPGVTHNYIRAHEYNIWFTLIAQSMDAVQKELAEIEEKTGVPVLNLPAERLYKIKVDFQLEA